jgi:hypothetical protein
MKSLLFILVFDYAIVTLIDQSDDVVEFDESISTNLSKLQTYHMEFHISNVGGIVLS